MREEDANIAGRLGTTRVLARSRVVTHRDGVIEPEAGVEQEAEEENKLPTTASEAQAEKLLMLQPQNYAAEHPATASCSTKEVTRTVMPGLMFEQMQKLLRLIEPTQVGYEILLGNSV